MKHLRNYQPPVPPACVSKTIPCQRVSPEYPPLLLCCPQLPLCMESVMWGPQCYVCDQEPVWWGADNNNKWFHLNFIMSRKYKFLTLFYLNLSKHDRWQCMIFLNVKQSQWYHFNVVYLTLGKITQFKRKPVH